jgi:hypothetical protein
MDANQTNQVIVLTTDQAKMFFRESVAYYMEPFFKNFKESSNPTLPEKLSKDQALAFLAENGFPTTTGNLYKMTANNEIPCARIGKRLIFSKTNLLNWIESRSVSKTDSTEKTAKQVAKSANNQLSRGHNTQVQDKTKKR